MKKQSDFHKTVQNLMLLDPESLLLIDSGVKLLLARQNMGRKQEKEQEEDPRVQQAVIEKNGGISHDIRKSTI